jgi:hypothetical protein
MGCCGGYRRTLPKPRESTFKTLGGKDRKACKFCLGAMVQKVIWKGNEKVVTHVCSVCGRPGA